MSVQDFMAWQKADALFDVVVEDLKPMRQDVMCQRLISQQIAAADSICANIEEGYGRESKRDYAHYLVIARGSAQETKGRYGRMKHWLASETIGLRQAACNEIIAILTATIRKLRSQS